MNDYYVYGLTNPLKNNQYFYIGKGRGDRCMAHFKEKKVVNAHKTNTINQIQSQGLVVGVVKIKEGLSEDEAYALEDQLIKQYGRSHFEKDGILTNICVDMQPPNINDQPADVQIVWRERIQKANQAVWTEGRRTFTDAMRSHLPKLHSAGGKARFAKHGQWNTGLTQETDERMARFAENKRGKTASDATKAKMSATRTGRKHSKDHAAAISAAQKGRVQPQVTCHCGKTGGESVMKRWHLDKCRTVP